MTTSVPAPTYPTESYSSVAECCCNEDHAALARHVFVWPERLMTVNVATRAHWRVAAQFTADWREAFRLMANGCAPLAWCNITVQYIHGTNRKMDVGAEALAVKAAIDGIVAAGVLPDDNPAYVRSARYLAPVYVKGEERLILTLDGPVA